MNNIQSTLSGHICKGIKEVYGIDLEPSKISLQKTNKEFEGDFTLNVFPLLKIVNQPAAYKKPGNPESLANEIGG